MSVVDSAAGTAPPLGRQVPTGRTLRVALAVAAPLAPLAILVGRYLTRDIADSARALAFAAENPPTLQLYGFLELIIAITLVPGVLAAGLAGLSGSPRWATAGLLLGIPAWGAGLAIPDSLGVAGALTRAGADPDVSGQVLDQLGLAGPALDLTYGLFVIGHIVATVVLGVALYRSRAVPRVVAVGLAVSQPLHFVAFIILQNPLLDAVAYALTAIGFGAAGLAIARRR
jgi:hypothetical protein